MIMFLDDLNSLASFVCRLVSASFCFIAAAPVVSFSLSENTPLTTGGIVTISGLGFSSVDRTSTAAVASNICSTAAWASATSVACAVSVGSSSGGAVGVGTTVQATVGTRTESFSFDGGGNVGECGLPAGLRLTQ